MKMAIVHQLSIIKLIADFIKTDQKDLMVQTVVDKVESTVIIIVVNKETSKIPHNEYHI